MEKKVNSRTMNLLRFWCGNVFNLSVSEITLGTPKKRLNLNFEKNYVFYLGGDSFFVLLSLSVSEIEMLRYTINYFKSSSLIMLEKPVLLFSEK